MIKHVQSGKMYIGQSRNISKRWNDHLRYGNSRIGKAIRKYGKERFYFEVLELCHPNDLNDKEIYYIGKFDSVRNGYNILPGGGQFDMPESVKIRIGNSQRKRYAKRPPKCFVTFSGGKQNAMPLNVRPKILSTDQVVFSDYQARIIIDHMFKPHYRDNKIGAELWNIDGADKEMVINALFRSQLA
ncbi:MAG: GIY-YIG nuclease family protein [Gammaproteobacteria bacterium]|nr:MAG: GIY-YIG nuclease family protein [Gammaproteobacteria bacterium]